MKKSIKNSNKAHQNIDALEKNTAKVLSKGSSVFTANLTIESSKIEVEVLNSQNSMKNFERSEKLLDLLDFLKQENVKGVRLFGKKHDCNIFAETCLKQGIRPLIGGIINSKNRKSKAGLNKLNGMPVINEFVAGIDIGKNLIYVAVPPHFDPDHTRVFGTFTEDLIAIVNWLTKLKITTVAMESTSVYWQPLYDLCEKCNITPKIINPKHYKTLSGRKTDVLDAQWLMRLLACDLLSGGFIPRLEFRQIRDLNRHRQDLIERAAQSCNRMHQVLSQMNIQLSSVLSDITGKSAMNILKDIVRGERNPEKLAALVENNCKCTHEEIAQALHGTYSEGYIFILKQELRIYENFHKEVNETELKMGEMLEKLPDIPDLPPLPQRNKKREKKKKTDYNRSPFCFDIASLLYRKFGRDLTIISGIEDNSATMIMLETGGNMEAFPTSKRFASWNGTAPGNKVSGGKKLSGAAPKKFSRVGQALKMAANANCRADTGTGGYFRRLIGRGKTQKGARKATAHKLSNTVYNLMKHGHEYVEKGAAEYEKQYEERRVKSSIKTLEYYGFDCSSIKKKEAA